ncbi:DegT/DnrJ/EryC1/StrS family aminotransferase [Cohnella herbarum]|uniref:DegT/DnrJ/EryC1/StrS family aminotransferase n=1 Tax=Cohnella herbarum TaxID=2728023 RepID=A0A7Z2VLN0_9BACL|nr:DegT/DnrJ/EryC1/StrS family aminotransferase [Cohnella herbarum]QJD85214.1 DegT/DnrJ/EryC1/StrS family aminotransferase [Cohnella herbarum]
MERNKIPVSGPSITAKELEYVSDAVMNAWYDNAGIYNNKFEKAFADYVGTKYAVSLPSCTSAIHLSLLAMGVGPGDEVIVPDITWIATAAPVIYVGATPVFADIDPQSWCLSAESFEKNITEKTKAVIPVDLYGNIPDMETIRDIAKKHNIWIVEDAAEAIGSEYKGKRAGVFGDTGVFSFHGSKTMTTGEGGMLVTDNEEILHKVLSYRDHGRTPGDKFFYNQEVGYKYKMSALQAALGLAQLERMDELVERKREIFQWYRDFLADIPDVMLNSVAPHINSTYWMVTIIVKVELKLPKEYFMKELELLGIDTRPYFHPLSSLPAFSNLKEVQRYRDNNLYSYMISPYGINLPSGLNITKDDVQYISKAVKDILYKKK